MLVPYSGFILRGIIFAKFTNPDHARKTKFLLVHVRTCKSMAILRKNLLWKHFQRFANISTHKITRYTVVDIFETA